MAKGKKSKKKTDPRQPARTEAHKKRRKEKWERDREKWKNDVEYQAQQVEHRKIIERAIAKNPKCHTKKKK